MSKDFLGVDVSLTARITRKLISKGGRRDKEELIGYPFGNDRIRSRGHNWEVDR